MSTRERQRGISIFRGAAAANLRATDFSRPSGQARSPASAGADDRDMIYEGRLLAREPDGFSLLHLFVKPNIPLPRHSHDSDCMYYVICGEAQMGTQKLGAGDSFFVPTGAPYQYTAGPDGVEVLEIRHGADHFETTMHTDAAGYQDKVAEVIATNRSTGASATQSPTFAGTDAG